VIRSAAATAAVLACIVPGVARGAAVQATVPRLPSPASPARPAPPALPQGAIRGVVLDTANGTGVARVSVRLQSTGRTAVTDDQGRFELAEVAPGNQELYVSAVDFILVKRTVSVSAGSIIDVVIVLSEGTGMLAETIDVRGGAGASTPWRREPAVAAEQTLGSRKLQQLRGILTNDPLRALQVLPAVAAGDDFRSEFAIRGAGAQHMRFTFEGIATPFLLHTVREVHDSGSIAMVNGDVLGEISLLMTPGVRVDRWSLLVSRTTASPWIQSLWPISRSLAMRAGAASIIRNRSSGRSWARTAIAIFDPSARITPTWGSKDVWAAPPAGR
jgi:hypothetical protein